MGGVQFGSGFPSGAVFQVVPVPLGGKAAAVPAEGPFTMFREYPDVMSTKQAAKALGVSEAWLREAIARGDVSSFRAGRLIKVPKTALFDFIVNGGSQVG